MDPSHRQATAVKALLHLASGAVIAGSFVGIATSPSRVAILILLGVASAGFIALALAIGGEKQARAVSARTLAALVVLGLGARIALACAPSILEDDVNRYLWDGAVLASGESPYAFSPQQVYDAHLGRELVGVSEQERSRLEALARLMDSEDLRSRFLAINYPSVPTIYPPVAQGMFAGLSLVAPGSLIAMKVALIALDCLTAFALLAILFSLKAPRAYLALYFLNPLILLSFAGSAHMDVLPMALLVSAIALGLRSQRVAAGVLLGFSAAAKLFPLVVVPTLYSRLGIRGLVSMAVAFAIGYALVWHPRMFEGLATFAKSWQINGAIHPLLALVIGGSPARTVGLLIAAAAALLAYRFDVVTGAMCAVAALVLVSPAVNPWYVAWIVPFAAATRSIPLLLLSLTVLASYARFVLGEIPAWLQITEYGIPLAAAAIIHFGRKRAT